MMIVIFIFQIRNLHPEHSHVVAEHPEHSHVVAEFKRQKREYVGFSHNDLKYVEFRGCVCSRNVFELASHLLSGASSLKKMTFRSSDRVYLGCGRWTTYFNDRDNCYVGDGRWINACGGDCWLGKNVIHEMLKDEVNEQCQLRIF
jgi:hypothetical protein